jgi:hypothetical protein
MRHISPVHPADAPDKSRELGLTRFDRQGRYVVRLPQAW